MEGKCSFFETRLVNHKQLLGMVADSRIIFLIKLSSPPSHQSSAFCPPKFRVVFEVCLSPKFFIFRCVPAFASAKEEWKGGLQIDTSKTSSGMMIPLKIFDEELCKRTSILPQRESLFSIMCLADLVATGSISEPTKVHP